VLRQPRGVSLAETIIACFVLTFAMLVSAALFHTALQHSVRIDRKQKAARISEQRVEQLRSWSRANHGTNGELDFTEGWDDFQGVETAPDNPGYEVETEVVPYNLFSPASEFEKINFAALEDENIPDTSTQKRTLGSSAYLATITVSWGDSTAQEIVTRTIFADPVRDHGWDPEEAQKAISLEYRSTGDWGGTPPASLPAGQSFFARAFVKDKNGETVENAVVTWYVDPDSTGNGTIITQPNSPERVRFRNEVEVDPDPSDSTPGLKTQTGGRVRLVARVRLGGVEAFQKTPSVRLGD
jgi:hypothetical protein